MYKSRPGLGGIFNANDDNEDEDHLYSPSAGGQHYGRRNEGYQPDTPAIQYSTYDPEDEDYTGYHGKYRQPDYDLEANHGPTSSRYNHRHDHRYTIDGHENDLPPVEIDKLQRKVDEVEADYSDSDESFYGDQKKDGIPQRERIKDWDQVSLPRDYDDSQSDHSSQDSDSSYGTEKIDKDEDDLSRQNSKRGEISSNAHVVPQVAVVSPISHIDDKKDDSSNKNVKCPDLSDGDTVIEVAHESDEDETDKKKNSRPSFILGAGALATVAMATNSGSPKPKIDLKAEEAEEIENLLPKLAEKIKSGETVRLRKPRNGLQERKVQREKEHAVDDSETKTAPLTDDLELQDIESETVNTEQFTTFDELYRSKRTQLISSPTQQLSGIKKWKHERSKEWKKNQLRLREFLANFEVWRSSFKTIEGNFGTSVLSYFRFLKWLLFLNFFIMIIVLSIIVFPQQFLQPKTFNGSFEGQVPGQTTEEREGNRSMEPYFQQAANCSRNYDKHLSDISDNSDVGELIIDFFQGTGWMEKQVLFHGYYFNKTYVFLWGDRQDFNMPLAYLLCTAAYFLVSLILMVRYTARGVREGLTHSGDKFYNYCNKVLCGWDYTLMEQKAAKFKHSNLFDEYKNDLDEQRRALKRANLTGCEKFGIYSVRFFVLLFVIATWCGSGYLIFWSSQESLRLLEKESVRNSSILNLLVEFLPSFVITGLNIILPLVFQKVVLLEDYSPEFEVKITIFRTVLLRLASIAVLVITMHNQIVNCPAAEKSCGTCTSNIKYCWETYVGQQIYKLVILDFIVVILVTLLVQFPRKLIVKKFNSYKVIQLIGLQEFEIPKNVLDLVYSQTLCWLGAFFSPLIPAITVLKFFIYFYIKKLTVLYTCTPPNRPYRASRSNSFFMIILIFSYILCIIPVVYSVGRIPPSQSCGPFRIYTSGDFMMYKVISHSVSLWPGAAQDLMTFLSSWSFYIPAAVLLCLVIYYYVAVSAGNRKMVNLLKEQLALEGKDKQFLLGQVRDALLRGDFKND